MRIIYILTLATWALSGTFARAETLESTLSFTPDYLDVDVKTDDNNRVQEARFNSGLGLDFRSDILGFAFDYNIQAQAKDKSGQAALSQKFGASFYSDTLNRILRLKADVKASGAVKQGGDAYTYTIASGVTKSFSDLARLDLQYKYLLDQKGASAIEKEKTGYRMGLSGKAQDGRLTWKGHYGTTDEFGGALQLRSTELLEFESRYQLMPELRLELSGREKNETTFNSDLAQGLVNETRLGAGLAWSPSQYYSVALKLNRYSEPSKDDEYIFGSGVFSWYPNRDLEFTLSYGDRLIEGAPALMLGTRIDLDGT
ncbi:MAG: hypothetical protein PVJ71_01965 [Lysobacterales bacterium]|jgi:hypothetical protein